MIGPEQAYTSFDPEYVTQWVSSSTKDAPPVFAKSFRTVFYAGPLARKERRSWIESDVVALDCKIGGGGATAANGRSGSRRRSAVRMTTLAGGAGCSAGSLAAMTVVRGATMAARAVMTLGGAAVCSVASLAMLPVIWTAMTAAATTATAATVGVAAVVAGTGGGYQTSHGRTAAPGAGGVC